MQVLQLELTPLGHNQARTHELSGYLMLGGAGPGAASRHQVMERLQEFLPPTIMLPPRRLTTLLSQVISAR